MPVYGEGSYGEGTYGDLLDDDETPEPEGPGDDGGVLEPAIPTPTGWDGVTLSNLRTRLRMRLNESTAAAWSDDELNDWLNEGNREVCRQTMHLEATCEITAVERTQSYVPDALAGCLMIDRVEYLPAGQSVRYPLEYRDFKNLEGVWFTAQSQTVAIPEYFTIWGIAPSMKLVVYPTPAIAGKFRVYYWRIANRMTTDSDLAEVPNGWDDLIIDYGEYMALRRDRDLRWRDAKAKFDERVAYMLRYTMRHTPHPGFIDDDRGGYGQLDWLYGSGW